MRILRTVLPVACAAAALFTVDLASAAIFGSPLAGPPIPPGDYNGDCQVDGDDYLVWRDAHGSSPGLAGWNTHTDANRDGVVDFDDYTVWRDNLGKSCPIGPLPGHPAPPGRQTDPPPSELNGDWEVVIEDLAFGDLTCQFSFSQASGGVSATGDCEAGKVTLSGDLSGEEVLTGQYQMSGSIGAAAVATEFVILGDDGFGFLTEPPLASEDLEVNLIMEVVL